MYLVDIGFVVNVRLFSLAIKIKQAKLILEFLSV